jgi:hypothetical protein
VSVLESQTFFEVQIELPAVNPHSPADIPGFEPDSTQGIAISFYNYYNSFLCFVNTRFTQTKPEGLPLKLSSFIKRTVPAVPAA